MNPADLRAIVERMTAAPWYPRGRFLSLRPDNTGMGATLHTNHVANFAREADAAGVAALRDHAGALLALVDAVRDLRDCGGGHVETVCHLADVLLALKAFEVIQ